MPSYFYHLKLDLYPHPSPNSTSSTPTTKTKTKTRAQERHLRRALAHEFYLPTNGCDIFDTREWPGHRAANEEFGVKRIEGNRKGVLGGAVLGGGGQIQGKAVGAVKGGVIDCGPSRAKSSSEDDAENERIIIPISRTKELEFPPPNPVHIKSDLGTASKDWRFGEVRIESLDLGEVEVEGDMEEIQTPQRTRGESSSALSLSPDVNAVLAVTAGLPAADVGRVTKARYRALEKGTEVGWGVVHLYRDGEETMGLNNTEDLSMENGVDGTTEDDFTVLCIPAVPSYLTPSDFLGFIGEKTRDSVSHIRMVMTGRMNRYLVLLKFRDGKVARRWRREWDGRVFNSMEPETCQVVFIKTITVQTPTSTRPSSSFPELSHDPFNFPRPLPPPTPSLIELPTCPVCLERMDDTTGLLTILCQHVFHCDCLQKWSGGGCPVCRHTNPSIAQQSSALSNANSNQNGHENAGTPFGIGDANLCAVCDTTDDLWICLICGNVGCGRYKGGHAKDHWKECAHNFALEIATQHVWDYAGDLWVHRLIRDKGDSKLIELPSRSRGEGRGERESWEEEMVPRSKLEGIGIEYTHLLSSQLDSQRVYFEDLVNKAAAKAAAASSAAAKATEGLEEAIAQLQALTKEFGTLKNETVPQVERELEREKRKAEKSAELARGFGRSLKEEKRVSEGLLERIKHVNSNMEKLSEEVVAVRNENAELKEENRDLLFSISAGQKIAEMGEAEGEEGGNGGLGRGELEGGTLSLPPVKEEKGRGGKRSKGKGKGLDG